MDGDFPGGSDGKEFVCSAGDQVRFLGWEDPLEKEMAIHCSITAWRIPWTEEPGGLQSLGSWRVGHGWRDLACLHCSYMCCINFVTNYLFYFTFLFLPVVILFFYTVPYREHSYREYSRDLFFTRNKFHCFSPQVFWGIYLKVFFLFFKTVF